jgi:hypothetical protein
LLLERNKRTVPPKPPKPPTSTNKALTVKKLEANDMSDERQKLPQGRLPKNDGIRDILTITLTIDDCTIEEAAWITLWTRNCTLKRTNSQPAFTSALDQAMCFRCGETLTPRLTPHPHPSRPPACASTYVHLLAPRRFDRVNTQHELLAFEF